MFHFKDFVKVESYLWSVNMAAWWFMIMSDKDEDITLIAHVCQVSLVSNSG